MDGQEHDFCWVDFPYLGGGSNAIHPGHIDVEKNDIRLQLENFFNGLFTVFGLTAYLKGV